MNDEYTQFVRNLESDREVKSTPVPILQGINALAILLGKSSKDLKAHHFYGKELVCEENLKTPHIVVRNHRTLHALLGLADELGELFEANSNVTLNPENEIDRTNWIEEIGDLCWYLTLLMDSLGTNLEEVLEANVAKLKKRYPEGFTTRSANNRNTDDERQVLEKVVEE